ISGNGQNGIFLNSFQSFGLSGSVIQGNLIGTDATGTEPLANGQNGLELFGGASTSLVGGRDPGAANVISGNKVAGIFMQGDPSGAHATSNAFLGNFIGTDITGTVALANGAVGVDLRGGS